MLLSSSVPQPRVILLEGNDIDKQEEEEKEEALCEKEHNAAGENAAVTETESFLVSALASLELLEDSSAVKTTTITTFAHHRSSEYVDETETVITPTSFEPEEKVQTLESLPATTKEEETNFGARETTQPAAAAGDSHSPNLGATPSSDPLEPLDLNALSGLSDENGAYDLSQTLSPDELHFVLGAFQYHHDDNDDDRVVLRETDPVARYNNADNELPELHLEDFLDYKEAYHHDGDTIHSNSCADLLAIVDDLDHIFDYHSDGKSNKDDDDDDDHSSLGIDQVIYGGGGEEENDTTEQEKLEQEELTTHEDNDNEYVDPNNNTDDGRGESPYRWLRAASTGPAAASETNDDDEDRSKQDVLELLEQLGDLTLDFYQVDRYGRDHEEFEPLPIDDWNYREQPALQDYDDDEIDDLPAYLYCQPCHPSLEDTVTARPRTFGEVVPQLIDDRLDRVDDLAAVTDSDLDFLWQLQGLNLENSPLETMSSSLSPDQQPAADSDRAKDQPKNPTAAAASCTTSAVRPQAVKAAQPLLRAFQAQLAALNDQDSTNHQSSSPAGGSPINERACIGHKERILGMDLDETGQFLATSSQDATVRIWNASNHRLLSTLTMANKDFECLRVAWASSSWGQDKIDRDNGDYHCLLASGGADGVVKLWGCRDPLEGDWQCLEKLDHASYSHFHSTTEDDSDKPQVYALEFIDHWRALPSESTFDAASNNSFLMTSSDDHVHLWEIDAQKKARTDQNGSSEKQLHLREVFSLCFGDMHNVGYGVRMCSVTGSGILSGTAPAQETSTTGTTMLSSQASLPSKPFGGERNPQNLVYVFEARYCDVNGLLGVALSDGSLRLMNGRGLCLTILHLPGIQSHLTSFSWDSSGQRLATSVATGHVITWQVEWEQNDGGDEDGDCGDRTSAFSGTLLRPTVQAILSGGHEPGRPLFGALYCGSAGNNDTQQEELLLSWGVDGRLCLWDACACGEVESPMSVLLDKPDYPIYAVHARTEGIVVAGGGSEGGFVGIPVYLYDYPRGDDEQLSKKAKKNV